MSVRGEILSAFFLVCCVGKEVLVDQIAGPFECDREADDCGNNDNTHPVDLVFLVAPNHGPSLPRHCVSALFVVTFVACLMASLFPE